MSQNMKATIWDLDGTIVDSYAVIVKSLRTLLSKYNIHYSKDDIYQLIKEHSVQILIEKVSAECDIPFLELKNEYSMISKADQDTILLIPNAKEILSLLSQHTISIFCYTHRGHSTCEVLSKHGIIDYFTEIITSENNFNRKPDPEGLNYLLKKYNLEKENTYYIGDRDIDVLCAQNAGVKSILLDTDKKIKPSSAPDYYINDLMEIKDILIV